jgi:hypothetical protein
MLSPMVLLPPIAQKLISEYAKPVTRPDWRKIRRTCVGDMYKEIMRYKNKSNKYDKHYTLYSRFIRNVQQNYEWFVLYKIILQYGLEITSEELGINQKVLHDIIYS